MSEYVVFNPKCRYIEKDIKSLKLNCGHPFKVWWPVCEKETCPIERLKARNKYS